MSVTPDIVSAVLASIAGALLSLGADYMPGFSAWYACLDGQRKRLVMLGLLTCAALVIFVGSCVPGWVALLQALGMPALACDRAGAVTLLEAFFSALVANQSVFTLAHRPIQPRRRVNYDDVSY